MTHPVQPYKRNLPEKMPESPKRPVRWEYIVALIALSLFLSRFANRVPELRKIITQNHPQAAGSSKNGWMDTRTLQKSPIRHPQLTQNQLNRIKTIQRISAEVDDSSLDEWVDDFKRDEDPESEIVCWEAIAHAYLLYLTPRKLSLEAKKEVYALLFMRSMAPENEVLAKAKLRVLTKPEALQVLAGYKEEPLPLKVKQ